MFDVIDATGSGYHSDPRMREIEGEMIRSHELCLKISARKPTDPDYKGLLEELFQHEIDDSVAIVSPFYCDCGCRMTIGKHVTINKGATILSPGKVVIEDNVLIDCNGGSRPLRPTQPVSFRAGDDQGECLDLHRSHHLPGGNHRQECRCGRRCRGNEGRARQCGRGR